VLSEVLSHLRVVLLYLSMPLVVAGILQKSTRLFSIGLSVLSLCLLVECLYLHHKYLRK